MFHLAYPAIVGCSKMLRATVIPKCMNVHAFKPALNVRIPCGAIERLKGSAASSSGTPERSGKRAIHVNGFLAGYGMSQTQGGWSAGKRAAFQRPFLQKRRESTCRLKTPHCLHGASPGTPLLSRYRFVVGFPYWQTMYPLTSGTSTARRMEPSDGSSPSRRSAKHLF